MVIIQAIFAFHSVFIIILFHSLNDRDSGKEGVSRTTHEYPNSEKQFKDNRLSNNLNGADSIHGSFDGRLPVDGRFDERIMSFRERRFIEYSNRVIVDGPGEMGKPVILSEIEIYQAERMKNQGVNIIASDKVSLQRTIPDLRIKE